MNTPAQSVDISLRSIMKFFVVVLALAFLYEIRDIALMVFVSLILAAAIRPAVDWLEQRRVPRSASVFALLLLIMGAVAGVITLLVPPISEQISQVTSVLPGASEQVTSVMSQVMLWLSGSFSKVAGPVYAALVSVFGGVVTFVGTIVLIFYLLREENALRGAITTFVPASKQAIWANVLTQIQDKISGWLKGQLVLSGLIGLMVYAALTILGVKYALVLALLAFVGEFVPYLGPILSSIPAILVAFVEDPIKGLFTAIIFIVIQQAENHILVPRIMQHAVGLNPVVSIVSLLIGAKLAGLMGMILAIPVATAVAVLLSTVYASNESSKSTTA